MGIHTTHGSVLRTISIHYLTTFVVVMSLCTLRVVIRPEGCSCKRIVIDCKWGVRLPLRKSVFVYVVLCTYVKLFCRLFSTMLVSGGWIHWFSFFLLQICLSLFLSFLHILCCRVFSTHKFENTFIETHKCQLKNGFGLKLWRFY